MLQELEARATPPSARAAGELLAELRHAFVLPILALDVFGAHALAVLPFSAEGTLHQLIARLKREVNALLPATPAATMVRSSFMSTSLVSPLNPSLVSIYSLHEQAVRKFARQVSAAQMKNRHRQ